MNAVMKFLMNSLRIVVSIAIIGAGVAGFYFFGQKSEVAAKPDSEQNAFKVNVMEVTLQEEPFIIEVDGGTTPFREITYAAEIGGRISRTSEEFRSGKYVEEGDFLLEIDQTNTQLEVERLTAQVEQSAANLEEMEVEIKNTEDSIAIAKEDLAIQDRKLKRIEPLYRRGTLNESDFDDARKAYLTAKNSLQLLENQKRMAQQKKTTMAAAKKLSEAQLKRAEADLKRTTITAPIHGTIISHEVEQNDYIKQGDPLFRINDTTKVEVLCNLELDDLYWVWLQSGRFSHDANVSKDQQYEIPETPVTVAFDFQGTTFLWDGKFSRYEGTGMDRQTRTFPCRVIVDKPTESKMEGFILSQAVVNPPSLLTGMYVTIRIPIKTKLELLSVPVKAIRPGDKVYVVREGKLKIVNVFVARTLKDHVLVRRSDSSLQPGDMAITSPLPTVTDGMDVKIINDADDSNAAQKKTSATAGKSDRNAESSKPAIEKSAA